MPPCHHSRPESPIWEAGGGADSGVLVIDPTQVTAIQWQLNVPATGGGKGTVTIDDINFVK